MFQDLIYKPKPDPLSWLEENITIPREFSPNAPGRFDISRTPYLRELYESRLDIRVKELVLSFGTQSSKTFFLATDSLYGICNEPMEKMWVLPTDPVVRRFTRKRFLPLLKKNPVVSQHLSENKDEVNMAIQVFDRMTIAFTGATEPSKLSGDPIQDIILDEAAKYKLKDKTESHPIYLARERSKSFTRKRIIIASTPTVSEDYHWKAFQEGDFRKYFVPCPHCHEFFTFEFSVKTLVWDAEAKNEDGIWIARKVEESARYVCPHCQGEILDRHKPSMLSAGEWRPTKEAKSAGTRSYHLNSFYSPFVCFGEIATEFLKSKQDVLGMHNFYNSWLALPYDYGTVKIEEDSVLKLRGKYRSRFVPAGIEPYYLSACYDPGDRTHYVVGAVCSGGETYVIDWGSLLSIDDIEHHLNGLSYRQEGSDHIWTPTMNIVDSGWQPQKCFDLCVKMQGLIYPSRGREASFGSWAEVPVPSHVGLSQYSYSDRAAKTELYHNRISKAKPPLLHLPLDSDEELIKGLSGQEMIIKKNIPQWKELKEDHYGDCIKEIQLTWWILKNALEPPVSERKD